HLSRLLGGTPASRSWRQQLIRASLASGHTSVIAHCPNSKVGKPAMKFRVRARIIEGVASVLALLLLGSSGLAQKPNMQDSYLTNIRLCNGTDRTPLEARISACTALIDGGQATTTSRAVPHNNPANAYAIRADYDRSIQDFDHAIKLKPTYAKAFNNRGVAHLRKGEYDLAIRDYDEAIHLDPGYAGGYANRAEAYLKKGEYQRATQDYDAAIRVDPDLVCVWGGRCWTRAILAALQPR